MTEEDIINLQKKYGVYYLQAAINTGQVWKMKGPISHHAMEQIQSGACMLSTQEYIDYFGNIVPSRDKVDGPGSYEYCHRHWRKQQSLILLN